MEIKIRKRLNGLSYFILGTATLLLFGLASCSVSNRFSEYEGVNLISVYSLASNWVPDYNTASSPTPANSGGLYMTYEDSGETYNSGPAYRLRTVNMFPNGDFEDGTATGWVSSDPVDATFSVGSANVIQGSNSMTFHVAQTALNISYPLANLKDGFLTNTVYTFRFSLTFLQNRSDADFEINALTDYPTGRNTIVLAIPEGSTTTTFAYPDDFTDTEYNNTIYKGSTTPDLYLYLNTLSSGSYRNVQHAALDKLRFLRSDLGYKIRLKLFRKDSANPTRLELTNGTYKLSVYVKQDPAAGSSNVFAASRIALGINRSYDTVTKAFLDDSETGIAATSDWSGWTQVSATFKNVNVEKLDASYPSIELTISATDSTSDSTRDVGSILIASPSLVFLPDE